MRYAYDRFEPVSERFLLEGEKKKAVRRLRTRPFHTFSRNSSEELKFEITQKCFFDIEVDENFLGRIVGCSVHLF